MVAREHERRRHGVPIDRDQRVLGVLLDDREEIAQQPPLVLLEESEVGRYDMERRHDIRHDIRPDRRRGIGDIDDVWREGRGVRRGRHGGLLYAAACRSVVIPRYLRPSCRVRS